MEIRTILVPCDFSEHSGKALAWALGMAEQSHAKVILLHVVPLFAQLSYPGRLFRDFEKMDAELVTETEKHLPDFLATQQGTSQVPVEFRVLRGDPVGEICEAVKRESADLIVMGSHGRTGLPHVLLGSVAERVVRHAQCPVMVVRLPASESKET